MASHWLVKTEPEVYSIDDLKRDVRTLWDGVRNYQARNFLRDQWKVGDEILVYHSSTEPTGIVGLARVKKGGVIDPSQFDKTSAHFDPKAKLESPTWYAPEVEFVAKFPDMVELERLRKETSLKDMQLLKRGNRLSVIPVTKNEFETIVSLSKG